MTLGDLCALVAGRVPLVIEVKSHFDGDRRLVKRMAEVLAVLFRPCGRHVLRSGPGAGAARTDPRPRRAASWRSANIPTTSGRKHSAEQRRRHDASAPRLPHPAAFRRLLGQRAAGAAPWIARNIFGLPLLTWTVRTPEQRARAARYADQMIFEGFLPGT